MSRVLFFLIRTLRQMASPQAFASGRLFEAESQQDWQIT